MSNSGNPPDSSSSYSGFQSPYMINSDSESDSNSRQEYASQHPTVPSEMGLRYMTIPASDDSRCVQPLQEPPIGCFSHALAISIHPNHVHCFPLGTNTSSHTRLTSSDPSLPILLVSYPWITATAAFALLHVYRAAHCRNFIYQRDPGSATNAWQVTRQGFNIVPSMANACHALENTAACVVQCATDFEVAIVTPCAHALGLCFRLHTMRDV
jgi:hypothetical protein